MVIASQGGKIIQEQRVQLKTVWSKEKKLPIMKDNYVSTSALEESAQTNGVKIQDEKIKKRERTWTMPANNNNNKIQSCNMSLKKRQTSKCQYYDTGC